jgi:hypothetical protein
MAPQRLGGLSPVWSPPAPFIQCMGVICWWISTPVLTICSEDSTAGFKRRTAIRAEGQDLSVPSTPPGTPLTLTSGEGLWGGGEGALYPGTTFDFSAASRSLRISSLCIFLHTPITSHSSRTLRSA